VIATQEQMTEREPQDVALEPLAANA